MKDWKKGHTKKSQILCKDGLCRIENFRDMNHYTGEENYSTKIFSIQNISQLNIYLVPFGKYSYISHVMLEFFEKNGETYTLSIEARRRDNQKLSLVKGCFLAYKLFYIWGTSGDHLSLRRDLRGDDVWMYHTRFSPQEVQDIFLSFVVQHEKVRIHNLLYHSIFSNCITNTWKVLKPFANHKTELFYFGKHRQFFRYLRTLDAPKGVGEKK